jgi:hypothetical protein
VHIVLAGLETLHLGTVAMQGVAYTVEMLDQLFSVGQTSLHMIPNVVSRSEFVYKEFAFLVCSATLR